MTVEKLEKLPLGTRVVWNRKGSIDYGNEGRIAEYWKRRFIEWDDGKTLGFDGFSGRALIQLRWVKQIKEQPNA